MKIGRQLLAAVCLGGMLWLGLALGAGRVGESPGAEQADRGPKEDRRPVARRLNVILIVVDTLRPDHMGVHGYTRNTTPQLDAFARSAVSFNRAYTQAPWTIPAIASLFTSQYVYVHQVNAPPEADEHNRLDERFLTLAEALRAEGYHTAAITSQPWLRADLGFAQGFDEYKVVSNLFHEDEGEILNDHVSAWLAGDSRGERPFFLYVHTMGPHAPYHARPPYRDVFAKQDPSARVSRLYEGLRDHGSFMESYRELADMARHGAMEARDLEFLKARYDEKLAAADDTLGRLIDSLRETGVLDRSLVILTADHGEAFGEHGNLFHSQTIHPEDIRIPLIIHDPRTQRRRLSSDSLAELIDVYPTILDMLELPVPQELNGRSLLDSGDAARRQVLARASGASGVKITTEAWSGHFEHGSLEPERVYDLRADPHELRPLGEAEAAEGYQVLRAAAAQTHAEIRERDSLPEPRTQTVGEELRRQLESLGYLQ